jgi:hypothetical protein
MLRIFLNLVSECEVLSYIVNVYIVARSMRECTRCGRRPQNPGPRSNTIRVTALGVVIREEHWQWRLDVVEQVYVLCSNTQAACRELPM